MRKSLMAFAVFVSMFVFPGTWVEAYGAEGFRQAIELAKNIILAY